MTNKVGRADTSTLTFGLRSQWTIGVMLVLLRLSYIGMNYEPSVWSSICVLLFSASFPTLYYALKADCKATQEKESARLDKEVERWRAEHAQELKTWQIERFGLTIESMTPTQRRLIIDRDSDGKWFTRKLDASEKEELRRIGEVGRELSTLKPASQQRYAEQKGETK